MLYNHSVRCSTSSHHISSLHANTIYSIYCITSSACLYRKKALSSLALFLLRFSQNILFQSLLESFLSSVRGLRIVQYMLYWLQRWNYDFGPFKWNWYYYYIIILSKNMLESDHRHNSNINYVRCPLNIYRSKDFKDLMFTHQTWQN